MRRSLLALVLVTVVAGCGGGDRQAAPDGPFAYDAAAPLDADTSDLGSRGGVDVERVTFSGRDGTPVEALFAVPGGAEETGACVIYQGGIGTTKEQAEATWPAFAAMGAATLTVDARDQSAGTAEGLLEADLRDPARLAGVLRGTVVDLRRGIDWLESSGRCRPGEIGYVGFSFGGLVGAQLAGVDDRVAATVLLSAGGGWPEILNTNPFVEGLGADPEALDVLAPLDPLRWVGRIAPRPVLLAHGNRDEVTSAASFDALAAAAKDPKTIVRYPGGHEPFGGADGARLATQVTGWLRARLSS